MLYLKAKKELYKEDNKKLKPSFRIAEKYIDNIIGKI